MKLYEVMTRPEDKRTEVMFGAIKKKKNNPRKSKTIKQKELPPGTLNIGYPDLTNQPVDSQ